MNRRIVVCPYCGEAAVFTTGEEVYPHRPDLHRKRFYLCRPCKAYVGCHRNGKPLGRLANAQLRKARIAAHSAFDPFWRSGRMTRSAAYRWLAKELDLPISKCHIGMFDILDCRKVVSLCRKLRSTLP